MKTYFLPIAVCVPVKQSRIEFFESMCLPSIRKQNVEVIQTNHKTELGPNEKRNRMARKSDTEFLFFCDDDCILPDGFLAKLLDELRSVSDDRVGYVYTDFKAVVLDPKFHPKGETHFHKAKPFSAVELKKANFISSMVLIKRSVFPEFDETLESYSDWDLFLELLEQGIHGKYVPEISFEKHFFDPGITTTADHDKSLQAIRKNRNLSMVEFEDLGRVE